MKIERLLKTLLGLTLGVNVTALSYGAGCKDRPSLGWTDSVVVDGKCYCKSSNFDHGIGTVKPAGFNGMTVRQICAKLGTPPPGKQTPYNDIQCGNGPANTSADEQTGCCPGRVDFSDRSKCAEKGPLWDKSVILGSGGNSGGGVNPPSGYTRLRWRHSNKCMDISGGSQSNGGNLQQWDCVGNTNQNFRFEGRGGGFYNVRVQRSNRCWDVSNGGTANGTNLQQWGCSNSINRSFKIVSKGGGWFQLVSQRNNKCVDVSGVSSSNGANIHFWSCGGGLNQQLRFD